MPTDDYTNAEIVRSLQRIESGLEGLESEVKAQRSDLVTRSEWGLRKEAIDREQRRIWAAIDDVKATAAARSVPWTSVAAILVALASLAVTAIPALAN